MYNYNSNRIFNIKKLTLLLLIFSNIYTTSTFANADIGDSPTIEASASYLQWDSNGKTQTPPPKDSYNPNKKLSFYVDQKLNFNFQTDYYDFNRKISCEDFRVEKGIYNHDANRHDADTKIGIDLNILPEYLTTLFSINTEETTKWKMKYEKSLSDATENNQYSEERPGEPVPEPEAFFLFGLGLLAFSFIGKKSLNAPKETSQAFK